VTAADEQTSLDLIGQLLTRARRWEWIGAIIIISATFSAGMFFATTRAQFLTLEANQQGIGQSVVKLQDDLVSHNIETNNRVAERRAADERHDDLIKRLAETDASAAAAMRELSTALAAQQQQITVLSTNQANVLRLLEHIEGSPGVGRP
jgi:predicted  nucleic acid-binding Zn-ribbon protein